MIGFNVGAIGNYASAKSNFFDRATVLNAATRAERRVLSRMGAFIRTRAISLLLRHPATKGFGAKSKVSNRQGISPVGEPPYPHLGLIPRFVFFAYEPENHSCVIGPVQLGKTPQAMRVLEEGGTETIEVKRRGVSRPFEAHYRPRPFMRPAFDAELDKAGPNWQDEIK